jgi:hypothetical protein
MVYARGNCPAASFCLQNRRFCSLDDRAENRGVPGSSPGLAMKRL